MPKANENDVDERNRYFAEKYKGKVKFAGMQHGLIKQVNGLINNTRPNPKKLFVVEGIWALEKAMKYNLYIESFAFCPECIYTPESEKTVDDYVNAAQDSYIVSKRVFLRMSERKILTDLLLSAGFLILL